MKDSIGIRIKELRKLKNISQEELANELEVSRQTISKWESDLVSPEIKNIEMITKYFNVSADFLINGKESKTQEKKIWMIILFTLGIITITITTIFMILNKGKNTPSSTINFSYEAVLLILGFIILFIPFIYLLKKKFQCK